MSCTACFGLFVLTVAWVAVYVGGQDSCVDEELYQKVYSCFSSQGLQLPLQPGQQNAGQLLRETQTVDPETQCKHREVYKAATNCTLAALKTCLALSQMEGAIPEVSRFHQGMDVICDRKDEFDTACLKSRYPDIIRCGERTVKNLVETKQNPPEMNDIICISAEVNYDCASEYLKTCGKSTVEIFLQQLDQYQVPSVCVDRSPGRPGRRRYDISGSKALHSSVGFSLTSGLAAVISLAMIFFLH